MEDCGAENSQESSVFLCIEILWLLHNTFNRPVAQPATLKVAHDAIGGDEKKTCDIHVWYFSLRPRVTQIRRARSRI